MHTVKYLIEIFFTIAMIYVGKFLSSLMPQQCNNPKTKEPKLNAAMRIVPEWNGMDSEIKHLWDRVYKNKSTETTTQDVGQSPTTG